MRSDELSVVMKNMSELKSAVARTLHSLLNSEHTSVHFVYEVW